MGRLHPGGARVLNPFSFQKHFNKRQQKYPPKPLGLHHKPHNNHSFKSDRPFTTIPMFVVNVVTFTARSVGMLGARSPFLKANKKVRSSKCGGVGQKDATPTGEHRFLVVLSFYQKGCLGTLFDPMYLLGGF